MSKWKEISRGAKKMASKAISKTGDLSDTASLKLKLKRKQAFLADLYEQFGRIAYQKMKTGAEVDYKLNILIEKIDIVRSEIYKINKALNDKELAHKFEKETEEEVERSVKITDVE
ncbi:MAG: hypothetical protein IJP20_06425 [Clostridia bacterium]|nr:hypothetical protein [Clostridia bacterium]